jgi:sugar transferase EpsL
MNKFLKRAFDLTVSSALLVVLSPLLVATVIAIRWGSRGPAVFKQERAGKGGIPFVFYKFRTMRLGVDPFGPSPKSCIDMRLTKIGKVLREYSLDELPQLLNIVRGDMSLVGPRPLYASQIQEWDERQKKRLLVKPGLTGLAQVSGRGELTREEKLALDAMYVETATLWLDCKIILSTVAQVFGHKGIYEKCYSGTEYTRGEKMSQRKKDA